MSEKLVTGAGAGVAGPAAEWNIQPELDVTPEPEAGVDFDESTSATEADSGESTPTQETPRDAELQKLVEDINRLKSAAQRREYELSQRYQAQIEAYQQQLLEAERQAFEATTRGMSPEERRVAEAQWQARQREQQLQQELMAMRTQLEDLYSDRVASQRKQQAISLLNYLTGIPEDDLARHASTPDELVEYARSRWQKTKQEAQRQPPSPPRVTRERPAAEAGGMLKKWMSGQLSPEEKNALIERAVRDGIPLQDLR